MSREKISEVRSRTVVLPQANIDTDQIIPARFLKTTTREGLGQFAFADWRQDPAFPLNQPEAKGAQVLVAGPNFACGSSREHAPWALLDCGFRAVLSVSIADIFRSNALKNGLLPVIVSEEAHRFLLAHPGAEVTVDVRAQTVSYPGGSETFPLDPFARYCLLEGIDELGFLLAQDEAISAFERARDAAERA